jgi:hypothetical protein
MKAASRCLGAALCSASRFRLLGRAACLIPATGGQGALGGDLVQREARRALPWAPANKIYSEKTHE